MLYDRRNNIMKKLIVAIILVVTVAGTPWSKQVDAQEQYFQIINAYEYWGAILEEWKSPGKYSPINMFDNDTGTCFAIRKDNGNDFILRLQLEAPITCDRMEVLGGVALNEDLYMKNNRPRKFTVWLFATEEDFIKDNVLCEKTVILEDKREYQVIQFDKPYTFKRFILQTLDVYKGTQYDDTCVTELKLFNGGQEIKPKDIAKMRKVYKQRVGERLQEFLSQGVYDEFEGMYEAVIDGKGNIKWKCLGCELEYVRYYFNKYNVFLTRLYVKDSRLYAIYKGKEYLVQYQLIFYTDKPKTTTTTVLVLRHVGGEKFNSYEFTSKEMMRKVLEYYNEILGE